MSDYQDFTTRFEDWILRNTKTLSVYTALTEMGFTVVNESKDESAEPLSRADCLLIDASDAVTALMALDQHDPKEGKPSRVRYRLMQLAATCVTCMIAIDDQHDEAVAP